MWIFNENQKIVNNLLREIKNENYEFIDSSYVSHFYETEVIYIIKVGDNIIESRLYEHVTGYDGLFSKQSNYSLKLNEYIIFSRKKKRIFKLVDKAYKMPISIKRNKKIDKLFDI